MSTLIDAESIIYLFNKLFQQSQNTVLVRGRSEPIYLPANSQCRFDQIVFAHGFVASAFHEVAHWCVAGDQRRLLEDYGYWYQPDGRSVGQQAEFERVEVKPQALEWVFSKASNQRFCLSADNLSAGLSVSQSFKLAIIAQVQEYFELGFPERADLMISALCEEFRGGSSLAINAFCLDDLN